MIACMVAGLSSGSGKTAMTLALLALLQREGYAPCAFKCGPDYIDPTFHREVLGVQSHNLDLFLSDAPTARRLFGRYAAGCGAAVVEGVMGFFDGVGMTEDASAYRVAEALALPVLLVLRPRGAALTLAAQVNGLRGFRSPDLIRGLLLDDCPPTLADRLMPMLERETGLPVLGVLPPMEEANLASRHLGLVTAPEIAGLRERIGCMAEALGAQFQMERFFSLCGREIPETDRGGQSADDVTDAAVHQRDVVRIAVARDEAFCFLYGESLDALRDAGAETVFFSPMRDGALPEGCSALLLPGGYPELYAEALAENRSMRRAVADAVRGGLPVVAECGGYLYLKETLADDQGRRFPMAGVLPGTAERQARPVRFGYAQMTALRDGLLFHAGETVPVHEFHYWDAAENGADFALVKPGDGRRWRGGYLTETLCAGFPHLYLAGDPRLAKRFVGAARTCRDREEKV